MSQIRPGLMPPKLQKQAKPPRKPMKRKGRKTEAWEKVRRNLKPRFEKAGITECELNWEGCWRDNGLGFAHAKKRRNLGTGELSRVILACNHCHDILEALPEGEMGRIVMVTIGQRKMQPYGAFLGLAKRDQRPRKANRYG